jgi:hypothetical protein
MKVNLKLLAVQIVGLFVVFALSLFVPAGTLAWAGGWAFLYALGTPLVLGAWYGLVVGLVLVLGAARRAVLEERTLGEELQGYADYMNQVKYRFVPGVW